ncbi:MAG: transmembrane(s)proteins 21..43 [Microgenomates bacterium 39_6]|nr:MAG: transmembrane(s)proteins 21..43 [Microgenomates bacterium 39_6]
MNHLNKQRHKTVLVEILKEIYTDKDLKTALGFKGGTAAFLFYDLPRMSVDLDFDLLKDINKSLIVSKVKEILGEYGRLDESTEKKHTLFFLLNYELGQKNIKVEISKRKSVSEFETKNYLGIPMLVMKQPDMAAGKLSALITRRKLASRDLFDLWYFLKNKWEIREKVVRKKTGLTLKEALEKALEITEKIPQKRLLQGMGELVGENQKEIVKKNLKKDLAFQLRLYLDKLD